MLSFIISKYWNDVQIKQWNIQAMLCFLLYTVKLLHSYEIHALAFSCVTAFLCHSQLCTLTTKKLQTTAVKKAAETSECVDSFSDSLQ